MFRSSNELTIERKLIASSSASISLLFFWSHRNLPDLSQRFNLEGRINDRKGKSSSKVHQRLAAFISAELKLTIRLGFGWSADEVARGLDWHWPKHVTTSLGFFFSLAFSHFLVWYLIKHDSTRSGKQWSRMLTAYHHFIAGRSCNLTLITRHSISAERMRQNHVNNVNYAEWPNGERKAYWKLVDSLLGDQRRQGCRHCVSLSEITQKKQFVIDWMGRDGVERRRLQCTRMSVRYLLWRVMRKVPWSFTFRWKC